MVTADKKQYVDPEPWVHRWPNSRDEDIRSTEEQCVVKDCVATYEPRGEGEMRRILENRSAPRHWWSIMVSWVKELLGNLRR